MTAFEVDEALKTMCILVDTREKKNLHITDGLQGLNCPYKSHKLDYGDYSCEWLDGAGIAHSFADRACIERKASLDEIALNFTSGRERFRREFGRAAENQSKIYLMIEKGSYKDIINHKYRSQYQPNSFLATLWSWQEEFNMSVNFIPAEYAAMYIKGTLFYALKKYLLTQSEG